MNSKKLNVLLSVTDALRTKYKNMVGNYSKFFANKQGNFFGEKGTYEARDGALDDPTKKKYVKVVTTVDEKFDYFLEESKEFINALFSQERTNASGLVTANLIVEGKDWGKFTSLELLRLKSLLESSDLGNLEQMLSSIPVRSDAEIWQKTTAEEYQDRNIWQSPLQEGVSKTTEKEEYILIDPNIERLTELGASYSPKTSVKTKPVEVGDYTYQKFSGEWSQREKAAALKRRNDLLVAVIKALKECNDVVVEESALTAEKIFGYIFKG
jgi:hypothetical protein